MGIEISYMDVHNDKVLDLLGDNEVALTAGEHQIMGSVRFHFPQQSLEDGFRSWRGSSPPVGVRAPASFY